MICILARTRIPKDKLGGQREISVNLFVILLLTYNMKIQSTLIDASGMVPYRMDSGVVFADETDNNHIILSNREIVYAFLMIKSDFENNNHGESWEEYCDRTMYDLIEKYNSEV